MKGRAIEMSNWVAATLKWFHPARTKFEHRAPLLVSNLTRQTVLASQLEIADQGETRRKGLLGRSGIEPGGGLWIKPCEAVHTVGMRFAIDLVYLDRALRIKKVRSNVGPYRISACLSAHSILELPSGTIERTQTQAGDRVAFLSASRNLDFPQGDSLAAFDSAPV